MISNEKQFYQKALNAIFPQQQWETRGNVYLFLELDSPAILALFLQRGTQKEGRGVQEGRKGSCFSIRRDVSRIESVAYGASRIPGGMSSSSSSSSICKFNIDRETGEFGCRWYSRGREDASREEKEKEMSPFTTLSPPAKIRAESQNRRIIQRRRSKTEGCYKRPTHHHARFWPAN